MYYTWGTKITFNKVTGEFSMKDDKSCAGKLSACNLGVSLGVTWGLYMVLVVAVALWFGVGHQVVQVYGNILKGVSVNYSGMLIGFFWGFLQGYIFGFILAKAYNFCSCRCPCSGCKTCRK